MNRFPLRPKNRKKKPQRIKYFGKRNGNLLSIYLQFSQPNFYIKHIVVKHDENGNGTITFEHKDYGEPITDPLQISENALNKIKELFAILDFLNSDENYQSPNRDYGHLGNHTVTLKKDSHERTAKYNWTENKNAKALVDEYRKVAEQFIWYFDMNLARQNQPLEAPILVSKLESLLKRNEISDPQQMIPYLKDLNNDERIPLLARNHVGRIIKDIEKNAAKN